MDEDKEVCENCQQEDAGMMYDVEGCAHLQ